MTTLARVAALLLAAAMLVGCTTTPAPEPTPAPRPVTSEEAQLLAVTRFMNFDRGSRAFSTELAVSGVDTQMQGWIDYESALGYSAVTGSFGAEALLWTDAAVGSIPTEPDADGNPPLPIPPTATAGWEIQQLDPTTSAFHALLASLSALGQDRPDNPLLVQQSGALWLRDDEVDGTPVTVFASPLSDEPAGDATVDPDASPLRIWVDSTGLMLRVEVRLDNTWTVVDFPDVDAPDLNLPGGDE